MNTFSYIDCEMILSRHRDKKWMTAAGAIHRFPPCVVDPLVHDPINEQDVFESAKDFLSQEFGVPVHVTLAEDSEHVKAATALPFKPAIVIE